MAKFYGIQPREIKDKDIQAFTDELNKEKKPVVTPQIDPK